MKKDTAICMDSGTTLRSPVHKYGMIIVGYERAGPEIWAVASGGDVQYVFPL